MSTGRVSVGRRNLLADRRRLTLSVLGVGFAIALMLLIQGVWSGALARVTSYEDDAGAQLFVAEPGTRSLRSDESSIPRATVETVRALEGVEAAAPIAVRGLIVEQHGTDLPVVLIGSTPGALGGPASLPAGRAVEDDGEIAIDAGFAEAHGYRLGDGYELLGRTFTIVGLVPDSRSLGNLGGYMYVTLEDAGRLLGTPSSASFVLVRTADQAALAPRIRDATGLEVLTAEEVARGDRELYEETIGSVVRAMLAIAFAAGTLIVAMSVYSSVVERIREYGIVKALGASRGRLFAIVLAQTLVLAIVGTVAGLGLYAGAKAIVSATMPEFHVELPSTAFVRAFAITAVMALLAAVVPARRVGRLDPASVYRG